MPHFKDMSEAMLANSRNRVKCETVPLNKVGDYYEGNHGDTTLLMEWNDLKSLAILESGASLAIATKQVWETWGKIALRRTRMKL